MKSFKKGQTLGSLNSVTIQVLSTADITINPAYQREQPKTRIESLVENFDWQLCGCLKVVRTGRGKYEAPDTAHRLRAINARHPKGILVLCEVLDKTGPEAFLGLNNHHPPTQKQKFKAHYHLGTKWAVGAYNAVVSAGFTPRLEKGQPKAEEMANMEAWGKLCRDHGETHVKQCLRVIKKFRKPNGDVEKVAKQSRFIYAVSNAVRMVNVATTLANVDKRRWTAAEYVDGCNPSGSSSTSYANAIGDLLADDKLR